MAAGGHFGKMAASSPPFIFQVIGGRQRVGGLELELGVGGWGFGVGGLGLGVGPLGLSLELWL